MARTLYVAKKFTKAHRQVIDAANGICEDYAEQGLVLTLRQLYYQFVARGLIPNKDSEYDRLGSILNDARLAGEMDWDFLIDRTRNLLDRQHWDSPADMVKWASEQYFIDLWKPQKRRIEVWVEKDAAIGVIEDVCRQNDVAYFSCRGYTSASAIHEAAQRHRWFIEAGEQVTVLHIGDHDPSGLHMTNDIESRLRMFISMDWVGLHPTFGQGALTGQYTRGEIRESMIAHMREKGSEIGDNEAPWRVQRIALTYDQVQQYSPPPNPAKTHDARFRWYYEQTGLDESWELDALDPVVMQNLVQDHIDAQRNEDVWAESNYQMDMDRELIAKASQEWPALADQLASVKIKPKEKS